MELDDEERLNNLQSSLWEADKARKHLTAQIAVLEAVCLVMAGQPTVKEMVLARLREIIATCSKANQEAPQPDWPIEEHYLRRFMLRVEDL